MVSTEAGDEEIIFICTVFVMKCTAPNWTELILYTVYACVRYDLEIFLLIFFTYLTWGYELILSR